MKNLIKRDRNLFWFAIWLSIVLIVCTLLAILFYVNGQLIASARIDAHNGHAFWYILIAIILVIILTVRLIVAKQITTLKWFSIPIILFAFALLHIHIGSLFSCYPLYG